MNIEIMMVKPLDRWRHRPALHPALTHLDKKYSYVRILFIDSVQHSTQSSLNSSLTNWSSWGSTPLCALAVGLLTGRPQAVRVGINTSSIITLNTGAPQGCVLSPVLFTLLTHDCTPSHNSNLFIKFADDTTVVGLISNRDETNYRSEVSRLAGWCSDNNLSLNVELLWPSTVQLWREWAAPSSWVCTSQRTSPGLTTLQH